MQDQLYETEDGYSLTCIENMETWLDDEIGTDYERNGEPNAYYLMIYDLSHEEVRKIRSYEKVTKKC